MMNKPNIAENAASGRPQVAGRREGYAAGLVFVTALAIILRLIRLGSRDFWHDEVHILVKSSQLAKVLLEGDLVSNHPPLFTTLVAGWRALGWGNSEWSMRLLPLLLGVAGVIALFHLGRTLFDTRVGFWCAFMLAISPFHVTHSQDLKVYILLPFTATIMIVFLWKAVHSNETKHWALYAFSAAIACYSEYFVAPMLLAINLWALPSCIRAGQPHVGKWVVANVVGASLFLPQLHVLLSNMQEVLVEPDNWWIPPPSIFGLAFLLKTVAFGYYDLDPVFKITMVVFYALVALGVWTGFKRNNGGVVLLILWFVVPIATVWAVSLWLNQSVFLFRALLPYTIPLYVLGGIGLAGLPSHRFRLSAAATVSVLVGFSLWAQYAHVYAELEFPHRPGIHAPSDFAVGTQYILDQWEDGDIVYDTADAAWLSFYWYGLKDKPHYFVAADYDFVRYFQSTVSNSTSREDFQNFYVSKDIESQPRGKRVWLVFAEWERASLQHNPMSVWRWMDAHYVEISHATFKGFEIFCYARADEPGRVTLAAQTRDNGERATVQFGHGKVDEYIKSRPDIGIVPTSPAERAGKLVLSFAEGTSDATASLAETNDTRVVHFQVSNTSGQSVLCDINVVSSDLLLPFATFTEALPEEDAWLVTAPYTDPSRNLAYDYPVARARTRGSASHTLSDSVSLPPGAYRMQLQILGSPATPETRRADLQFLLNAQDFTKGIPKGDATITGWNWFTLPEFLQKTDTPVNVEVKARGLGDNAEAWADVAYLAFSRVHREGASDVSGMPVASWPGAVSLAANETRNFSVALDSIRPRVDVWVHELGSGGRAYHIFKADLTD